MAKPEITVSVQVTKANWRADWPCAARDVRHLISVARELVVLRKGLKAGFVDVVLADDRQLRALNHQFRGKDKPTNVLSFPDGDEPFGGMALSYETIRLESKEQGKSLVNHSKHMILHGLLHLLGHDHQRSREARLMEQLEIAILSELGISNPYEFEDKSRA